MSADNSFKPIATPVEMVQIAVDTGTYKATKKQFFSLMRLFIYLFIYFLRDTYLQFS